MAALTLIVTLSAATLGCTAAQTYQFQADVGVSLSGGTAALTLYATPTAQVAYVYEYICKAQIKCTVSLLDQYVSLSGSAAGIPFQWFWESTLDPNSGGETALNNLIYGVIVYTGNQLLGSLSPCLRTNYTIGVEPPSPLNPGIYYISNSSDQLVSHGVGECYTGYAFGGS